MRSTNREVDKKDVEMALIGRFIRGLAKVGFVYSSGSYAADALLPASVAFLPLETDPLGCAFSFNKKFHLNMW